MKCLWFAPLLLFVLAGPLAAQEPVITAETPVDYAVLHRWLNSGDPRLIAWSADFARRTHNTEILAEMPELLQHWNLPRPYGRDQAQAAQVRAAAAVLDALIQENSKVTIPAIELAAESFPSQATILIARLPLSESRVTLETWSLGATGSWRSQTLARISSMMLAKDPGRSQGVWRHDVMGFVASVVAASETELQITISSKPSGRVVGGTTSCGDSFGHDLSPGWPQVYTYDLVENYPDATAPVVVDLDGDHIASRRYEENRPWGSCSGVEGLDSPTRHRLIAHWLGVSDDAVPWQAVEPFDIAWTDKAAYERELGAIVESQRAKLRGTVRALRQRGFLTEDEASSVAPTIAVTVECEIKPCPLH